MNEKDLRNEDLVAFTNCRRYGFGFGKDGQVIVMVYNDGVYSTLELDPTTPDNLRKVGEMFLAQARKVESITNR